MSISLISFIVSALSDGLYSVERHPFFFMIHSRHSLLPLKDQRLLYCINFGGYEDGMFF